MYIQSIIEGDFFHIYNRGINGMFRLNASKQSGHLFNSYAQAINKELKRTGSLFESPFERKRIADNEYIKTLVVYCNKNAEKHGFVTDFRDWEFSSYHSVLSGTNNFLAIEKVIQLFGSPGKFRKAHQPAKNNDLKKHIQKPLISSSTAIEACF
jgi:REP-associated tyrosine transposase